MEEWFPFLQYSLVFSVLDSACCHDCDVSFEQVIIYKALQSLDSLFDVSVCACVIVAGEVHDIADSAIIVEKAGKSCSDFRLLD